MAANTTSEEWVNRTREYIASLSLPEADPVLARFRDRRTALADEKAGGAVDDGALVSFVAGISAKHKEDVLNSTLLAQLAANKKYDREDKTEEWYDKYREVLENVGWTVSGFDFTKYKATSSQLEIEKVVLEILATIATGPEVAAAIAVLAALKEVSKDSKPFRLWDVNTNNGSKGNFQIGTCLESDGNVAMSLGAFHFKADQVDFQFLWVKYASTTTEIYKGGQQMVLNEDVYSQVREDIKNKLGQYAVDYVADLEI